MANCLSFMVSLILFGGLETLGVLSDGKLVDDLLDITSWISPSMKTGRLYIV